jgi:hypothetical protein
VDSLLVAIDGAAMIHREHGDENQLVDAIKAIRGHISESANVRPRSDH